jgi:predicted acylesterase/phospholipase RssA
MEKNHEPIQHLVISGGGIHGLIFYGILKEMYTQNSWKIEDIKTIYGTSVGTIIAIILCLMKTQNDKNNENDKKYNWETINNYLIQRPWQDIIHFNLYSIFNIIQKKGIFSNIFFIELFRPLFNGLDIEINITFQEFYKLYEIELHFFSTEINSFSITDFSYKTHPNMPILDALHSSCAIPFIFEPYLNDEKCYIDGGILLNNPLEYCLNQIKDDETVLCIYKIHHIEHKPICETATFTEYLIGIFNRFIHRFINDCPTISSKYEKQIILFSVDAEMFSLQNFISFASSKEERTQFIQKGVDIVLDKVRGGIKIDL